MIKGRLTRLADKYRSLVQLTTILLFLTISASSQTYNPSLFTVTNKSLGIAQAVPTDARSQYWDNTNFVARDYASTNEVWSYLNLPKYRTGHFPIYIHLGGSLGGNGVWTGGITQVWFFKDSVGNANLVRWYTDSTGTAGGPFYAVANNLSEGNAGLIKGNLALDMVNNTSDAQKNAASVALTNHSISGSTNTFSNIPNSALTNSTIGLTLNNSGSSPAVTSTPAALGANLVLSIPFASASNSGFLNNTNFTYFTNKIDSVHISNDSIYDCIAGACTFRGYITAGSGGGITSLNGLTTATQTFATGTAGSDFNISSVTSTHTFNFPNASASNRGLLTPTDWSTFNNKQSTIALSNTIDQYWNGFGNFVGLNSDSITEGTNHLFFTNTRARTSISLTTTGSSGVATYNSGTGVLNIPNYSGGAGITNLGYAQFATYDSITSSNGTGIRALLATHALAGLMDTASKAVADSLRNRTYTFPFTLTSLSAVSPLLYNNTTGAFSIQQANTSQSGYLTSTDWNTFNGKQGALTLTTSGSSGASSLIGNTLNIPIYTGGGSGLTLPDKSYAGNISGASAGSIDTLHYITYYAPDWGMKGDSTFDNTAALRNLRNVIAATPSKSGTIDFGYGDYIFSDSVIFAGLNIQIKGRGLTTSRISSITETPAKGPTNLYFNSATKNFLIFQQSATNVGPVYDIRDIAIINTTSTTAGNGVSFVSGTSASNVIMLSIMERVSVKNFDTCLNFSGNNLTVRDCQFENPTDYAVKLGNPTQPDNGGYIFENCDFVSGTTHTTSRGIYYQGGGYLMMHHCDWNSQENIVTAHEFVYCIYATFENGGTSLVWIHDCSMENYQTTGIYMHNLIPANRVANVLIHHNEFGPYNDNTGIPTNAAIDIRNIYNLTLDNNVGYSWTAVPDVFMRLDSITKLQLAPNVQLGWTNYDSVTNSTGVHVNVSTPVEPTDSVLFNSTSPGVPMKMTTIGNATGTSQFLFQASSVGGINLNTDVYVAGTGAGTPAVVLADADITKTTNYGYIDHTYTPGSAAWDMKSLASGSGTIHPMRFFTGTNTGQLVLPVNGTITMSSLASGGTAPVTSGTTNFVIADANGLLSWTAGSGGGTPGGANTNVQFNNSGAFGGSANMTWSGSIFYVNSGATTSAGIVSDGSAGHGVMIQKSTTDMALAPFVAVNNGQYFTDATANDVVFRADASNSLDFGELSRGTMSLQIGSYGVKLKHLPIVNTALYNVVQLNDSTLAHTPFAAFNLLSIDTNNVQIGIIAGVPASGNYFSDSHAGDMVVKPELGNTLLLGGVGNIKSSLDFTGTTTYIKNLVGSAGTPTLLVQNTDSSIRRLVLSGFTVGSDTLYAPGGGGGGVTTVGAFSGSSIANGASISGTTITFGPADATNPGMIKASGSQTLGATLTMPAPFITGLASAGTSDSVVMWNPSTNKLEYKSGTFNLYFANGLTASTVVADSGYLGGNLNQNTTINTTGTYELIIGNAAPTSSSGFRVDLTSNGTDATGDIFYRSSNSFWQRLAIGTSGQVLTSTGTVPSWAANPFQYAGSSKNYTVTNNASPTIISDTLQFTTLDTISRYRFTVFAVTTGGSSAINNDVIYFNLKPTGIGVSNLQVDNYTSSIITGTYTIKIVMELYYFNGAWSFESESNAHTGLAGTAISYYAADSGLTLNGINKVYMTFAQGTATSSVNTSISNFSVEKIHSN